MLKTGVYLLIMAGAVLLITFAVSKTRLENAAENQPVKKQLMLHRQGETITLDDQSPYFNDVVLECENLLAKADASPRLIMSADRISAIRTKQTALELILPKTQNAKLKTQQSVYYTKLLIPLKGEFSDGTVFFAGAFEQSPGQNPPAYSELGEYGSINFVRNTQGLTKLKEALERLAP